jgi:ABC-type uncharacterized transport system ATPase subunit
VFNETPCILNVCWQFIPVSSTEIESISLKNFRTFKLAELKDIPQMCVIVGANGTGKSSLFDVFSFLKEAMKNNVQNALNKRGGFKEVVSRGQENEDIELCIQFRLPIAYVQRRVTYQLQITLRACSISFDSILEKSKNDHLKRSLSRVASYGVSSFRSQFEKAVGIFLFSSGAFYNPSFWNDLPRVKFPKVYKFLHQLLLFL